MKLALSFALLCASFLWFGLATGQGSTGTLYAVTTLSEEYETVMVTLKVNLTTGETTNVTTNLIIAGASITVDGISAFDQQDQIYFYSNDMNNGFVFNMNVKRGQLLPPIDLYAVSVGELFFGQQTRTLYANVLYETESQTYEEYWVSLGWPAGPLKLVWRIPEHRFDYAAPGVVDETNGTLWAVAHNHTGPEYALNIVGVDIDTGKIISEKRLECHELVSYLFLDETTGVLLAGLERFVDHDQRIVYSVGKINPHTGACTTTALHLGEGIVVDWTYNPNTGMMYAAMASNKLGSVIFPINMNGNVTVGTPIELEDNYLPESMEIAYA